MTARRQIWICVAFFATAVAFIYPFSAGGGQRINMWRAERHIATLAPRLNADPRFANIRLDSFTGGGGSLGVFGSVATQTDALALEAIVERSNPPVAIAWLYSVDQPATGPSAPTR